MLTRDQLEFFADHGWIVLDDVFDAARCAAFRAGLDRMAATRRHSGGSCAQTVVVTHAVFDDPLFLAWLREPRILEANAQIIGDRLRFQGDNAFIRVPHPDRATRRDELMDPDTWGWHRGLRPRQGNHAHDDPRLIACTFLNNITYLTDVAAGDGATAFLDGSHLHEGDYGTLKARCPIVQPTVRAGSIVLFTETLIHGAVPIVSERTRYCQFHGFVPRFPWPPPIAPSQLMENLVDQELKALLGG